MGSLNKAMIIGFLGQDPDVRYTPSGDAVATISVATTSRWKDKQTGEQKEDTEWHRCTAWGKQAETIGEYLRKGSQVYIEGELKTRKWQDRDGNDRWTTEIRIRQFSFLDRREGGNRPPHPADSSTAPSAGHQEQTTTDAQSAGQQDQMDDFDDDIPFIWAAIIPYTALLASASSVTQWVT